MVKEMTNGRRMISKGLFILLAVLILQIPILLVKNLITDREDLLSETTTEISNQYGGRQTLCPPVLKIPYTTNTTNCKGETFVKELYAKLIPETAHINGDVQVETRNRSIYDILVYRADLHLSGSFVISEDFASFYKDKLYMYLSIGEMRGLADNLTASVNGKDYVFNLEDDGLRIELDLAGLSAGQVIDYSIDIDTRGAEALAFIPDASTLKVDLTSNHSTPSFGGTFLPDQRNVTEDGFDAHWTVTKFNTFGTINPSFHLDLIVPVSQYQQTTRATKYSFLIIMLVFMAIFLVEVVSRQEVNFIQYSVTGFSLCLFYLLLLSLSEYLAFSWAYLIASGMTVAALGGYFIGFLKSKTAIGCTSAVAVLYSFIYLLLNLETGSLLVGSLALFAILSVIMYFTRKNLSFSTPMTE